MRFYECFQSLREHDLNPRIERLIDTAFEQFPDETSRMMLSDLLDEHGIFPEIATILRGEFAKQYVPLPRHADGNKHWLIFGFDEEDLIYARDKTILEIPSRRKLTMKSHTWALCYGTMPALSWKPRPVARWVHTPNTIAMIDPPTYPFNPTHIQRLQCLAALTYSGRKV